MVKVSGWHFKPEHGFSGSCGKTQVSGYQRGGKVQRHTDKMAHKPDVDAMAKGGAINIKPSHKGLLHKDLGVAADKPIPAKKLEKATNSGDPAEKKRAVFAENAKHWNHKADGGKVSDSKQDKAMIKAAVHKHEKHDHKGEPLTKLKGGGKAKRSMPAKKAAMPSPMAQAAMAAQAAPPPMPMGGAPMGAPPMGGAPGTLAGLRPGMRKGGKVKKGC